MHFVFQLLLPPVTFDIPKCLLFYSVAAFLLCGLYVSVALFLHSCL